MGEQKMSYQERLESEKEEVINSNEFHTLEQTAERNIKAQAKAIREFWDYVNPNPNVQLTSEMYLEEHGYIESKQTFHCNNKGCHYSDPGYKPVCEKQCKECAEWYPVNGGYIDNYVHPTYEEWKRKLVEWMKSHPLIKPQKQHLKESFWRNMWKKEVSIGQMKLLLSTSGQSSTIG